ncbi:MAG: hypothetical protein HUK08_00545 [Bacteroidaceae bacterium]|nr:hypothetical protein [Bacteroidaceae bacterium]
MKKFNYMFAAAAMGLSLAACSSEGELNGNGNQQPDAPAAESVKTSFAINIGSASQGQSRMTAEIVQENGKPFRGMQNIGVATTGNLPADAAALANCPVTSWITLGDLAKDEIKTTESSKIYSNVSVPVGTQTFFFYGKAKVSADGQGMKNGWSAFGPVVEVGSPISNYSFTNATIVEKKANGSIGSTTEGAAILKALNAIQNVLGMQINEATGVLDPSSGKYDKLEDDFYSGNAGSAKATEWRVKNLVATLNTDVKYKDVTGGLKDAVNDLFNSNSDVKAVFEVAANFPTDYTVTMKSSFLDFPAKYDLPDGAALLKTVTAETAHPKVFEWSTDGKIGGVTTQMMSVQNVVYPSELFYYAASPVKASDYQLTTSANWNKTPADWMTNPNTEIDGTTGKNWDAKVNATTHTVAIENNINYGVAQLVSTIKSGVATELPAKAPNYADIKIALTDVYLSGIVVGAQPQKVGFNFLPAVTAESEMDRAVYDNGFKGDGTTALSTTASAKNYTLLFDNYVNVATPTNNVNVALEFTYNGTEPFRAMDGIVYKGMKFYVIGQLSKKSTQSIDWTAANIKGNNLDTYFPANKIDRVFVQDFTTTANFTVNSLVHSYVGIPDMRSTLLEFGLSVDLTWKSGLTFDVVID